jgi:hypothetical protein
MRFQYNIFLERTVSIISTHPAEIKTCRAAINELIAVAHACILDVPFSEFSARSVQYVCSNIIFTGKLHVVCRQNEFCSMMKMKTENLSLKNDRNGSY